MSGNRIYSNEIYLKEIEKLKMRLLYCPICYCNNISDSSNKVFKYINDYYCNNCERAMDKRSFLHKSDIRNIQIDKIIGDT